jgi:hypothetical protein
VNEFASRGADWRNGHSGNLVEGVGRCGLGNRPLPGSDSVGLKAKGGTFHEAWRFANEADGLVALQMSHMRDFETLASARLHKELPPIRQAGFDRKRFLVCADPP